jgi:pimeloyl-ACP methyl ester carboxylesterase
MEAIKSTLKAPGAVAGALGYYRSFFRSGFAAAGVASDGLVTVPALVLAGSADGSVDGSRFARARPAFAGPYTFVELDGVGHFPQLEAPQ